VTTDDRLEPDWKARYQALKARLTSFCDALGFRNALGEARAALAAASEQEAALRTRLAKLEAKLNLYKRILPRPEVVTALLPERAAAFRQSPPEDAALAREAAFAQESTAYATAQQVGAPPGADHVEIAGLSWWVPRDDRRGGGLADRVVAGKWLPIADILRTREAIANGVMLDIGANIGLTSVTRVVAGDMDLVYAAEPAPDNYVCLVKNVIENGLRGVVMPDCLAISDQDGSGPFLLSGSIGGHALSNAGTVEVATRRLDTWISELHIPAASIRYVKVDTQGRESHVLAGAGALLERSGVVWELEFSPRHLRRAQRKPQDLIAQMQSSFSHFIDLNPEAPGRRLRPIGELAEGLVYLQESFTNLLAYRSSATS